MPTTRRATPHPDRRPVRLVFSVDQLPPIAPASGGTARETAHTRREFARRCRAVAAINGRIQDGASLRQATKAARVRYATGRRWLLRFRAGGEDELRPRFQRSGRRSVVWRLNISQCDLADAQRFVLQAGSITAGLRNYAGSPDCPPALAQLIQSGRIPPSLARAVRVQRVPALLRIGVDWASLEFTPHIARHFAKGARR